MDTQTEVPTFNESDKRETNFFKFEEGTFIVGKLLRIEAGSFGEQYVLDTPDGEQIVGTYDVLKSKINESDKGKWIKILCKGNVVNPKTKRTYKDFDVFVKSA